MAAGLLGGKFALQAARVWLAEPEKG